MLLKFFLIAASPLLVVCQDFYERLAAREALEEAELEYLEARDESYYAEDQLLDSYIARRAAAEDDHDHQASGDHCGWTHGAMRTWSCLSASGKYCNAPCKKDGTCVCRASRGRAFQLGPGIHD